MESSGGNGLGKLLPKAINAKRKIRKQRLAREAEAEADDDAASRRPSSASTRSTTDWRVKSADGEADDVGDDGGSLGSYESSAVDIADGQRPALPATSVHASQIGYLTTSSPVIQATHLDSHPPLYQPPSRSQTHLGSIDGRRNRNPSPAPTRSQNAPLRSSALDPTPPARVAPPEGRSRPQPRIDTQPPRTPPSSDHPAPVIVSTPPTPVDRVATAGASPPDKSKTSPWNAGSPRSSPDGSGPSRSMSTHWRSTSGSSAIIPSKLSNTTLAPLTPTAESGEETPGAPGFFSSVISAAQNAATTLSNNIPGTNIGIAGNKSRSSLNKSQGSSAARLGVDARPARRGAPIRPRHGPEEGLGAWHRRACWPRGLSGERQVFRGRRCEDQVRLGARRVPDPDDGYLAGGTIKQAALPGGGDGRRSDAATRRAGLQIPRPAGLEHPECHAAAQKARKLGHDGKHEDGGRSGHWTAANSSVMNPSAGFGAPKLTGFAIASKRRNRDFHTLFKSVPDDDYLIEDYSCALQREILAHGRLYVSEGHLCFSSNILGWTTTLVMSFDEIVSVEKRSTALVFKNGLMISTLHAKHSFASFTSRDATYDLIVNIWKLGHPTLRSTLNGVRLEGTGGDKTEKVDAEPSAPDPDNDAPAGSESGDDSGDDDDDDFYDEEEHEYVPDTQTTELSGVDAESEKPPLRKVSGVTALNGAPADAPKEAPSPPSTVPDFPGPATHAPTDCGDSASHFDKIVGDDVIPAPLGKVYNLVFGPGSVEWMTKWLAGDQKCNDLQMEDKKGLSLDNKTRNYTYIKPLNASIGPRQTKCIVAETLENLDLEKAVNLSVSTQNPDVPSGNVFSVKTKYCLSWAENNATRLQVNCTVEWTGKSWLKGPIEKGVSDGQTQYCKDLFAALRSSVSSRSRLVATPNGPPRIRKKPKRGKALQSADGDSEGGGGPSHTAAKNWGLLEPVRGLVEPCVDVVRPLLTGNVMYGLLVGLLVAMWFGFGSAPSKSSATYGPGVGFYSPYRVAAYEEMWRLEERVGLDRLGSEGPHARKKTPEPRIIEEKLKEGRMDEMEVEEAIRVTEEKLKVLRAVVSKTSRNQERDGGLRKEGR
ncbi:GRAM domain containing protein [Ophiocordyceps sinensis CO18]|uniref:GRAM domain containing protein n=1 Tax=Ophiocordyceps sinensis (strain Co18 / CGMCC 3.14243) TaxID=911162 RepID=T5AAM4_OPHSC|nr:GRAM domain containing protein [Ophiocordyceps sinensis CO18]